MLKVLHLVKSGYAPFNKKTYQLGVRKKTVKMMKLRMNFKEKKRLGLLNDDEYLYLFLYIYLCAFEDKIKILKNTNINKQQQWEVVHRVI